MEELVKAIRVALRWTALLTLVSVLFFLVLFRSFVADGVRALQYTSTPATKQIVHNVRFTWLGKLYFYASHPIVDQTNRASKECGVEKSTAILGCYANGIIYVYDIDNSELTGVEDVTAAHEVLHAAYSRLSEMDKRDVDNLLREELRTLQGNKRFMDRMKSYDSLSEADRLNELHSVIGTEVTPISDNLETYYAKYFTDRQQIATMYQNYSSLFFRLQSETEQLSVTYNQLVEERNSIVISMNQRYDKLQASVESAKRNSISAQTARAINDEIASYNQSLLAVNQQLKAYDDELASLKQKIEASAAHQMELNQAIDSSLAPPARL